MPDILIRGMEMPTMEQAYKTLIISYGGKVYEGVHPQPTAKKKEPIAEAVELPPHGDLIDRGEYVKSECNNCDGSCECVECDCLSCEQSCRCDLIVDAMNAPVIVPAERRDDP